MNHILVAEDDAVLRHLLESVLSLKGYDVETASNGRDALLRLQRATPCLLLLDLRMPVMDGWEVYRRLQRDGPRDVGVIITTAEEDVAPADFPGVDILHKPFGMDQLLTLVEVACAPMDPKELR